MTGFTLHSPQILSKAFIRNGLLGPGRVAGKAIRVGLFSSGKHLEGFGMPGFEPPVISVLVGRGMTGPAELGSHVNRFGRHGRGGINQTWT